MAGASPWGHPQWALTFLFVITSHGPQVGKLDGGNSLSIDFLGSATLPFSVSGRGHELVTVLLGP